MKCRGHVEPPIPEDLLRGAIESHKEALCRDLDALRREVRYEQLLQTVREKPVSCLAVVAGASFLLAQTIFAFSPRREHSGWLAGGAATFLAHVARAVVKAL